MSLLAWLDASASDMRTLIHTLYLLNVQEMSAFAMRSHFQTCSLQNLSNRLQIAVDVNAVTAMRNVGGSLDAGLATIVRSSKRNIVTAR